MLFWAFINKTLRFGPFGYYYCSCSLDLGLGRFDPHFFKKSAPLAPGPTFGPWVEFWVQLPYPRKYSSRSNQSRCDTWRDTKNHPSQALDVRFNLSNSQSLRNSNFRLENQNICLILMLDSDNFVFLFLKNL